MSDDLVKRLWLYDCEGLTREAAARIEELEAKMITAEQRGYANAMEAERKLHEGRIEELEAKLEKLIAGAETVLEEWDRGAEAAFREAVEEMRADVAEAKGDKP
jgi:phenylacetate-coenzyme A ligase PaaK-like adenylate-forming protein